MHNDIVLIFTIMYMSIYFLFTTNDLQHMSLSFVIN